MCDFPIKSSVEIREIESTSLGAGTQTSYLNEVDTKPWYGWGKWREWDEWSDLTPKNPWILRKGRASNPPDKSVLVLRNGYLRLILSTITPPDDTAGWQYFCAYGAKVTGKEIKRKFIRVDDTPYSKNSVQYNIALKDFREGYVQFCCASKYLKYNEEFHTQGSLLTIQLRRISAPELPRLITIFPGEWKQIYVPLKFQQIVQVLVPETMEVTVPCQQSCLEFCDTKEISGKLFGYNGINLSSHLFKKNYNSSDNEYIISKDSKSGNYSAVIIPPIRTSNNVNIVRITEPVTNSAIYLDGIEGFEIKFFQKADLTVEGEYVSLISPQALHVLVKSDRLKFKSDFLVIRKEDRNWVISPRNRLKKCLRSSVTIQSE